MLSIARAAIATRQPMPSVAAAISGQQLGQIRMKHRKLQKKNKIRRAKKLAKIALKESGEWTPEPEPNLTRKMEDVKSILRLHCQNRDIHLNWRQRKKPWVMSLLAHRHDRGLRDVDELHTGGLRDVLTPSHEVTHQYILDNIPEDDENRFWDRHHKEARVKIRTEKFATFAKEALRALQERGLEPPIPAADMKAKLKKDPPLVLSLFARAMAEKEPDGAPRDLSMPPNEMERYKQQLGIAT